MLRAENVIMAPNIIIISCVDTYIYHVRIARQQQQQQLYIICCTVCACRECTAARVHVAHQNSLKTAESEKSRDKKVSFLIHPRAGVQVYM